MPKGKRGPRPPIDTTVETEPDIEQIVGEEHIVDLDDPGPVPDERPHPGYQCSEPGCPFTTHYLSEIEEHISGTGHGGYAPEDPLAATAVQPELFSDPDGKIYRSLAVPLSEERLTELHAKLGVICSESLAEEELLEFTKVRIKALKADMQEVRAKIRNPVEYREIECRWEILDENSKELIRLDTDEVIETRALTAEDRQKELDKAQADNVTA